MILGKNSKWKNPTAWAEAEEAKKNAVQESESKNGKQDSKLAEKGSAHVSTQGAFLQLLIELKAVPKQQVGVDFAHQNSPLAFDAVFLFCTPGGKIRGSLAAWYQGLSGAVPQQTVHNKMIVLWIFGQQAGFNKRQHRSVTVLARLQGPAEQLILDYSIGIAQARPA